MSGEQYKQLDLFRQSRNHLARINRGSSTKVEVFESYRLKADKLLALKNKEFVGTALAMQIALRLLKCIEWYIDEELLEADNACIRGRELAFAVFLALADLEIVVGIPQISSSVNDSKEQKLKKYHEDETIDAVDAVTDFLELEPKNLKNFETYIDLKREDILQKLTEIEYLSLISGLISENHVPGSTFDLETYNQLHDPNHYRP